MQPIPGCGFWGALLSSGSNVEALSGLLSGRDKVAADRNPPFHRWGGVNFFFLRFGGILWFNFAVSISVIIKP